MSELSRRDALHLAAGLGLSFLLPGLAPRAANSRGKERPKSLILLWLAGGPSQLETWDPHPGTRIGGDTKAIPTSIPGVHIAHMYPQLAEQLDKVNLVRSLVSKEGDHERGTYLLKTGYTPDPTLIHPSLGAMLCHELSDDGVEIPRHISIHPNQWPGRGGFLGAEYDAFKMADPRSPLHNVRARVDQSRQRKRLDNLRIVEEAFGRQRGPAIEKTLHRQTIERAVTMMTSAQLRAFQFSDEPRELREAYGDNIFGVGCLVARRLVEVGVRAVEVTLQGFDSHAENHAAHQRNAALLDPALATLLKDLQQRDLLDSTLVLCLGEFGRTPKINPLAGRDHWPTGFSALLGGGGLNRGVVIGETDPQGEKKDPADPVEVKHLYATVLQALGVDFQQEHLTPIGRPMRFSAGTPLPRLLADPA